MALVPSLSKPLASSRGALGKVSDLARDGLGIAALVNVADKVALNGRLTGMGYTLPFTLPGTSAPMRFNMTDVVWFWAVNGLKVPKGKGTIWTLAKLGLKKVAESKNWIDPPEWGYSSNQEKAGNTQTEMPMMNIGGLVGR